MTDCPIPQLRQSWVDTDAQQACAAAPVTRIICRHAALACHVYHLHLLAQKNLYTREVACFLQTCHPASVSVLLAAGVLESMRLKGCLVSCAPHILP